MINLQEAKECFDEMMLKLDINDINALWESCGVTSYSFYQCFAKLYGVQLRQGASKGCIIPLDKNFVFKLEIDACDREFFNDKNYYCEAEARTYKDMQDYYLDKYFAQTEFLTDYFGIKIYVQEKVEPFCEWHSCDNWITCEQNGMLDKITSTIDKSQNNWDTIPEEWAADFVMEYGLEEFEALLNTLDEFDINDIHDGNVGYIKNKPVIFDYSGWRG